MADNYELDFDGGGSYDLEIGGGDNVNVRSEEYINQVTAEDFDELESRVDTLEGNCSSVTNRVSYLESDTAVLDARLDTVEEQLSDVSIDPDDLGLYQDPDTYYVYPTYRGVASSNGIPLTGGGGGGGGGGNNAVLTVTNTTGWLSTTISVGATCVLSLTWSSIEQDVPTGNGTLMVTVDNVMRATRDIAQGSVSVDVTEFLGAGNNKVKLKVSDVYDNSKTITFTISCVELSVSSAFDVSGTFAAGTPIEYTYTPTGAVEKTVYFVVDGEIDDIATVTTSGRQQTQSLSAMSHGAHTLLVYFTAEIGGSTVRSNELYYSLVVMDPASSVPIIATSFRDTTASQYQTLTIPYRVYSPSGLTSPVTLSADDVPVASLTVDRTEQTWSYRCDDTGALVLKIATGIISKTIAIYVNETDIDVHAETANLSLYLTSYGRSNNEAHPEVWEDAENHISCTLTDFNFVSDGWVTDPDGVTVLRVSGDARVTVPYQPFASDFRSTGKTLEFEFATRSVLDYDAVLISCWSGSRGFRLTSQLASLASEQSSVSMQYKEDEHVRISFVAEKRTESRLLFIYVNGIMSGVVQYPDNDNFRQLTPVDISIGSNYATTDIYNIRVYDNDLTRYQILDNWIADTADITSMLARYEHNDVYDEYGDITIEDLPEDLPYLVISGALPQSKGDKKTVSGYYVDPNDPSKSFSYTGAQADVQGTSSQYYPRKNYKIKFNGGFLMTESGTTASKWAMNSDAVPTKTFTFKADVASSEGANNVELVRLYNSSCPYQTPPQELDARVRQGIDGFPIVIFHDTGSGVEFIGKYNFNNDKGTAEVYGFESGDESWETLNNSGVWALWQSADYSGSGWLSDFEARYPDTDPAYEDPTALQALASWIVTTDQSTATGNVLATPYVDVDGNTHTVDNAAYRVAKFRTEASDHFEMDSLLFYYLFTELFLMVDSRAKNAFPSFLSGDKWCFLPYDFDTALGIDNQGTLTYGYNLEDIDQVGTENVFNGQNSVLWINVRAAFFEEMKAMYQSLRNSGAISYQVVESMFDVHQGKWPEAVFNEDSWYKYIDPLTSGGNADYLSMAQGSKAEQRKWWLYNRFRYIDSKYVAGESMTDTILIRPGAVDTGISITPYTDMYASIRWDNDLAQVRATHGSTVTLACPYQQVGNNVISILNASQIASVGDLSGFKPRVANFSSATRLQYVKVGDSSSGYENANLLELYVGNNGLLGTVDARNCSSLTMPIDLSGATNIEHAYFGGTAVTGVSLPNGGILKTLQLPSTVTNITVINQPSITSFSVEGSDYSNVTTLRVENCGSAIPMLSILDDMAANSNVRIIGFTATASTTTDVEDFYDYLDTMRGLDESGNDVPTAVAAGTITGLGTITGAWLAQMNARYPDITIGYEHITSNLYYYSWDGATLVYTESITDGGNGTYAGTPSRTSTAQYDYTFIGWSRYTDQYVADPTATQGVTMDRNVYAAYSTTVRTYTVTWKNADNTTLETDRNVPYGTTPTYNGATPTYQGETSTGWSPAVGPITGDTVYTAIYVPTYRCRFYNGSTLLQTSRVQEGQYAVYTGSTPVSPDGAYMAFKGWDKPLGPIYAATDFYAQYRDTRSPFIQYIEGTMTDYQSSTATVVGADAFRYRTNLETAQTSATSIGGYAFGGCTALTTAELTNTSPATIYNYAFSACASLDSLILRSTTKSTLSNAVSLENTPIAIKRGAVYVPTALVSEYKADSAWSNYIIADIADYPLTDYSTISDSWTDIIAACGNGTYSSKYALGDTKSVVINGTTYYMQLVAKDVDVLATDGTTTVPTTWVITGLYYIAHTMNPSSTSSGGWSSSGMRSWLSETVFPLLPSELQGAIKEVRKYSDTYENGAIVHDQQTSDKLWIPSAREVFGGISYEQTGADYTTFFTSNAIRVRYNSFINGSSWWLRSAATASSFRAPGPNGSSGGYSGATSTYGVVLGFCI